MTLPRALAAIAASSVLACSSAPEYEVSCEGDVTKVSSAAGAGSGLVPTTLGPAATTACGHPDAAFTREGPAYRCATTPMWAWDGSACATVGSPSLPIRGETGNLHCTGDDCTKLFTSREACEAEYASCLPK